MEQFCSRTAEINIHIQIWNPPFTPPMINNDQPNKLFTKLILRNYIIRITDSAVNQIRPGTTEGPHTRDITRGVSQRRRSAVRREVR